MSNREQELSPTKQALLRIRELKEQLAAARDVSSEPVAIVSMACRFPRLSNTPEKFWQSLIDQTDEVSEIPEDRWDSAAFHDDDPEVPGKMYARRGVFLDQIDQMDPEFFGISPREATWVDPQQRLLMEVGWEAIERAGWIPDEIGEHTGIFVGWMHNDYQNEASDSFLNLNPYIATGAAGSFLCGRLAYYLGLQGPSIAVDTACSSSLVALHLAIQSLQRRDCDRALVGGVNAICSPTTNILTCKLKALSPSGHSRAFDAAADGYLRGEGCGVVTLRRLENAKSDGDSILGIIRGSAVGHNGFSSGLTAPNPSAQENVIRQAMKTAKVLPEEIAYLEAHGTGTELGDPIEMSAASAALSGSRSMTNPLLVGSVKTNIGHLEAAAGMAGLIKVVLSMQNGCLPGQLNFETPNPHIPWDKIPVKVLTQPTTWPVAQRRLAGVSAFGMSGTNAHVIIEASEPISDERMGDPNRRRHGKARKSDRPQIVAVSAKNQDALFELAHRYASHLENADVEFDDFSFTTTTGRSHFEHRLAVIAETGAEAAEKLASLARGTAAEQSFMGHRRNRPRVAWQFTGQGSQYIGMAAGLYETEPLFRDVINRCDAEIQINRSSSLIDVLFQKSDAGSIDDTQWTQPAIFAVQQGLAELLMSWGIKPDVVLGHSVGQYAAACVAGIMTWSDGLKLIAERGRLIGQLPREGSMLAVFAPLETVEESISNLDQISLAASNGTHVVVSGTDSSIKQVRESFDANGIRTKTLITSHAFHSQLMDPVLQPFESFANSIQFQPPRLPLICNVTGKPLAADQVVDGNYWASHIRQRVQFSESFVSVSQLGCELVMELGPQAVLSSMAKAVWQGPASSLISCLHRDQNDALALRSAVASAYTLGVTPDFRAMYSATAPQRILLPTYPFQRRRFWGPDKPRAFHAQYHTAHPLLGSPVSLAAVENEKRFESYVDVDSPAWMPDHEIMGQTVMPGAGFIEMALQVADHRHIENLRFEQPLVPARRTALQTVVRAIESKQDDPLQHDRIETYSQKSGEDQWTRHFSADIVDRGGSQAADLNVQEIRERCPEVQNSQEFYDQLNQLGLSYGPSFQVIHDLQFSATEVLSRLEISSDARGYCVPPNLLDGALHSLAAGMLTAESEHLFLPVAIGQIIGHRPIENQAGCYARWTQKQDKTRLADVFLFDQDGTVVMELKDVQVQQVSRSALRQSSGAGDSRLAYRLNWKASRLEAAPIDNRNWLIVDSRANASESAISVKLLSSLVEQGHRATSIETGNQAFTETKNGFGLAGESSEDWEPVWEQLTDQTLDGVCWLVDAATADDARAECQKLVSFSQSLLDRGIRSLECGIQLVTTDAIDVEAVTQAPVNPYATQFWGLGRVLGAEQPGLRFRLVDIPSIPANDDSLTPLIRDILLTPTTENQMTLRSGQIYVPRIVPARLSRSGSHYRAKRDHCYLVTGGLGQLGRHVTQWLAEKGAQQVVVLSRRKCDSEAQLFFDSVQESGCQVVVHSADASNRQELTELFDRFGNDLLPLAGVIHAAGVIDDGLIESQTWDRFEKVLRPKVDAAGLLHELTQEMQLDLFVLYSSAASLLGSPGQSNYATGNAFLDGLAWQRKRAGLPAVSINWGPWSVGMADDQRIFKRLAAQGIRPLSIDESHAVMERMLSDDTQALVMDVDWRRMNMGAGGLSPMLSELVGKNPIKAPASESALVKQLKRLSGGERRELVFKTLRDSLQQVLSTPEAPETDRPLIEMGLDSLMAVEFSTMLQEMLGDQFAFGPTMLFDHPTIDAIGQYILDSIENGRGQETENGAGGEPDSDRLPVNPSSVVANHSIRDDVAVIGMSCRFPGAEDIHEFWNNLLDGVDSVVDIPSDRWDIDRFYDAQPQAGKMYTRRGGFLKDIENFDAQFFNINDQEACWIDPQHRMLLENSYRALEDAGIPTAPLADPKVGVFMGIMGQDYAFLPTLDDEDVIQGFQGAGLSHSAGVGRISYMFGFEGPSVAVDTASSSSLVAVFQAMRSLQDGNCNLALAGGVNAILAPVNSLLMSKAGLLSPDGRCKSFSKEADGFGRGEGCGILVLKRLSDAKRDQDRIMAILRGGAVVHNGFSSGITSPNAKAQSRVISEAINDAGIAPSQVQYLEAHGTGTEFGDPIELRAAASIYAKGRGPDRPLIVGSVKANISHLEAAGGASGLIKTVLAIHHGMIPQQIHCEQPSPHVPWQSLPVKLPQENIDWPNCDQRMAGVTALGLVGTNAHLIVGGSASQSNEEVRDDVDDDMANLMVCSARSQTALATLVGRYLKFLRAAQDVNLSDFCYTTGAGRRHHEHRLAISFANREELLRKLASVDFESSVLNSVASNNGNGSPEHPPRHVHFNLSSTLLGEANRTPKLAWKFPDANAELPSLQYLKHLCDKYPLAQNFIEQTDEKLANHWSLTNQQHWSIRDHWGQAPDECDYPQLGQFLLQATLVKLTTDFGLEGHAALGFGIGQYSAACAAGCLCFFDAAILVAERERRLKGNVDNWHSFEAIADGFNFYPPNMPLVCSVSGQIVPIHRSLGGSYWRDHAQAAVNTDDSLATWKSLRCCHTVVFGTNSKMENQPLEDRIFLLNPPPGAMGLLEAIGRLYVCGCDVNFAAVYRGDACRPLSLPCYPFEKRRYWITEISRHLDNNLKQEVQTTQ